MKNIMVKIKEEEIQLEENELETYETFKKLVKKDQWENGSKNNIQGA